MAKVNLKAKAKKEIAKAKKELMKLKSRFIGAEKKVKSFVEKNPGKAAAIAAAVGVAVGAGLVAALKRKK
jgi:ElaB/YqjD/DUF883 family membrane-anchored ribosome-binding protein